MEPTRVAAMLGGPAVLGRQVGSVAELQEAVEQGLPKDALRAVVRRLFADGKQRRAAMYRVVPEATFKRRRERLSLVESERTERLARVATVAEDVLGDMAEARAFLIASHPLLDGRTPIDAAATDLGARRVEAILHGIEHGLPV